MGNDEVQPKKTRSLHEILTELRELTHRDGALHSISEIIFRDWTLTVDAIEGRIIDHPAQRWSTQKLNNNELMLLLGLAVQSNSARIYSVLPTDDVFASEADRILRELHDRIIADAVPGTPPPEAALNPELLVGNMAREAIYYGADGFYQHQFKKFARHRYRNDQPWMLKNVGVSINPIIEIATYISGRVAANMNFIAHQKLEGNNQTAGDLTNSLLVGKSELRKRFGGKVDAFLAKFTTPAFNTNSDFTDPFSVNQVSIAPLIDLGDVLYVPSQYILLKSVYESPFYWMIADKAYAPKSSTHRGEFLEKTVAVILEKIFGQDNVYTNVTLYDGKNIGGEIDVLVRYGEFVIVVQAKSKRVSLRARAGDQAALLSDFEGAIQAPYGQALRCAELIRQGARCVTRDGQKLEFLNAVRLFPMVILSDQFPASTLLSGALLKRTDEIAPVIWDVGFLDCVARILAFPIEFLFYLQARSENFERIYSDSEYNFLGFHINSKLALPADTDWMMLDRDYAGTVDDFMVCADLGIKADRPLGVLERLKIPLITEFFDVLRKADPMMSGVVVDLYDFSGAALSDLSTMIRGLRDEIADTGKSLKAFSVPTATGGITYAVVSKLDQDTKRAAELIGAKHKYDAKTDRWYVIVDCIDTEQPVDGLLSLIWPWEENEDEAERSRKVGSAFNSRYVKRTIGSAQSDEHPA